MTRPVEIRRAILKDAQDIFQINQFWIREGLNDNKSKGYLREKNGYSISQIQRLISESHVIVASIDDKVVSFYFINLFFNQDVMVQRNLIIEEKIQSGVLPKGRYALSLLAATDINHLGTGLNARTLNALKELVKDEYDYFVGIMSYDNIATQRSSLKMGWKHFGDAGFGLIAIIGTTDERNSLLDKYVGC